MAWQSVEELQQYLSKNVFQNSLASKKAAERALGTLVEIITFHLLKAWSLERSTLIERKLPEYANSEISHNVEFTLHPSETVASNVACGNGRETSTTITARKILSQLPSDCCSDSMKIKTGALLTKDHLLRNACVLAENSGNVLAAYMSPSEKGVFNVCVQNLHPHPFAVVECKRVGIEEGVGKGPQTIEKAKQGAYVARTVFSSLQRVRASDGSVYGVLCDSKGKIVSKPYEDFLKEIALSSDPCLLRDFTMTIGVVSNHGNWFTSEDHNKEMKVLTQSYDWLLFLTDEGLVAFVSDVLFGEAKRYLPVRKAFLASYGKTDGKKTSNRFTKTVMDFEANAVLVDYFRENLKTIEKWFNVISPKKHSLSGLKKDIRSLVTKNWKKILK